MTAPGLWQRLQQRKLVQWAAAYVATAFALLQGVDIVATKFERMLILALCIGFFVTLLLAWYHGERGAQRVSGTELLLLALLLAIGGGLLWKSSARPSAPPDGAVSAVSTPDAAARDANAVGLGAKSIAVQPLAPLGGNARDDYLGDGISEEVLNALSKLPGLTLIGRASSFHFRGRDVDAAKVGKALNVRTLLSGTLQRARDGLRINVELIDTATGVQLWSQGYDRTLKNLFVLEDDISGAVSKALALRFNTAGQPLVAVATNNAHAHDLVLHARQLIHRADQVSLNQALALLNQAIVEEPDYAEAWAGLSSAYSTFRGSSRCGRTCASGRCSTGSRLAARCPDMCVLNIRDRFRALAAGRP